MSRRDSGRRLFKALVAPALAIFMTGTNLCVLVALSGGSMVCSSMPSPRPSCSKCAHHGAAKSPGRAETPALSPCCVTLAPSAQIQIDKVELGPSVAVAVDPLAVVSASAFARPASPDERPPTSTPALDPHRGRAPPTL